MFLKTIFEMSDKDNIEYELQYELMALEPFEASDEE